MLQMRKIEGHLCFNFHVFKKANMKSNKWTCGDI